MANHLSTLDNQWHEHIGIEEAAFTAEEMANALNDKEQIEISSKLSQHTLRHAQPPALIMPFMLYSLERNDRETLKNKIPPDQREQIMHAIDGPWKERWSPMKSLLLLD